MGRRIEVVTSLVLATTVSGCMVLAGAGGAHAGGPSCVSSPVPPTIDLLIGLVTAAGLSATFEEDDSPAVFILPGVFLTSGLLGTVSTYYCRNPGPDEGIAKKGTPEQYNAPAGGPPTPTGDDPAPDTRDATPAETGITTTGPKADLRLDPTYRPKDAPPPAEDTRVACHVNPLTPCPANESCVLVDKDHGYCVPDR